MTAIERLIQGNREYLANSDAAPRERLATEGQHPYAVIITCSDSRDIPEVLFNAAIGELFVIRVAGNVLADHELGSVEYAVEHLGCRLVVMAIGAGAMTVSHANDSYFWVVTNFGEMTPEQGYKTQTLMTLVIGIAAMLEIFILNLIF